MKTKKLPDSLLVAIGRYYVGWMNSYKMEHQAKDGKLVVNVSQGKKWNKEKDFNNVCKYARKYGYYSSVCAGTFFLTNKNKQTFKVSRASYPIAEILK